MQDREPWTANIETLRILIADDNEVIRRGVAELLSSEPDWEICGEARNGAEALLIAPQLLPDLILLDVSMPGINGLEVARLLRQDVPRLKILVMSQHDPLHLLPRAVAAGADGCVDKTHLGRDLIPSIKKIVAAD